MPTPSSRARKNTIPCRRRPVASVDATCTIVKLTDWDDAICALAYPTFKPFSPDGRYLFFVSDRTGSFEIYRLALATEEAVQVTGPAGAHVVADLPTTWIWRDSHVLPARNALAYSTPRRLYLTDIESLETRVLAECPPAWGRFDATPVFNGDGTRFATIYERPDGRRGVAVGDVGEEPARLESVIEREPTERGPVELGHLIAAPLATLILSVTYSEDRKDHQNEPDLPPEKRARAWRLDPATGEFRPYLVVPPGYRATHHFFGPEGRLYFHRKTVPTWTPVCVASIDIDGNDVRDHYRDEQRRLGHACVANDASWLVTDVQNANDSELIHVDLASGRHRVLCAPNASNSDLRDRAPWPGSSQLGHVHPVSDFQSRRLAYQSDVDGRCGLYLADLPQIA